MAPYYSKAYLSTQVETADRVGLVVSLYEGALAHVNKAMEAIQAGDDQTRSEMIGKASRILVGLCDALDYTQDGGLSGKLFALYSFQLKQLLEANRRNDPEALQAVRSTLSILLEGWQAIANTPETAEMRSEDRREAPHDARRGKKKRGAAAAAPAARRSLVMTA